MTTTHAQFLLYTGDTWTFDAALHDNAGAALNLTGAVILWKLRDGAGNLKASLSVGAGIEVTNAAGGLCTITVPPALTAMLAAGSYDDEIAVTTADGFVTTQAVGGITVMKAGAPAAPDLAGQLLALKAARRSGQRRVQDRKFLGRIPQPTRSMAAAIAATESEIARTQGTPPCAMFTPARKDGVP